MTRRTTRPAPFSRRSVRLTILATPLALALVALGTGRSRPAPVGDPPCAAPTGAGTPPAASPAPGLGARAAVSGASDGAYGAPPGTRLVFDLTAAMSTRLTTPHGAPRELRVQLRAPMEIVVQDRRGDELIVAVTVPDAEIAADGPLPELRRDLATTSFVRMHEDGALLGYRFAAGVAGESRNWVRTLMAAATFVSPPAAGDRYQVDEPDATGIATTRYTRDGDELVRERHACRVPGRGAEWTPATSGGGRARFGTGPAWLIDAHNDETLVLALERPEVEVTTQIKSDIVLRSVGVIAVLPIAERDAMWVAGWEAACGAAEASNPDPERERRRLLELAGGADFVTLEAELHVLLAADGTDAAAYGRWRDRLVALLQVDERAVAELRRHLLRGVVEERLAMHLLSALGAAATPAAQGVLAELIGDGGAAPHLRLHAARAVFQVDRPEAAVVAALESALAERGADELVASTSLLAFGALSRESARGDDGLRLERLVALHDHAVARGMIGPWLEALGNAGDPAALPFAERYLRHEQGAVRLAAVGAIRGVAGDAATGLLAAAARDDLAPGVRAEAVHVLSDRVEPAARGAVARALREDASERVRRTAILALGDRLGSHPDAATLLAAAAADDPSAALRALAAEALRR